MSDTEYTDGRISSMVSKTFNLFVSGFNKFVILALPGALSSLFLLYYYYNKVGQLGELTPRVIITFIVITIINLVFSVIFTAALLNSAYSISINPIGESITESIKKGIKRFFPLIGFILLASIIACVWIFLTVFLPLIFIGVPLMSSLEPMSITTAIIIILIALAGLISLVLIFGVPISLYGEPEICVKKKCGVFEALNNSFTGIRGLRIKGFAYLIIISLIQLAFIALLFLASYLIVSTITSSKGILLKDLFSQGEEFTKINYLFGLTSSLASLVTVPFQTSAITVFYRTIKGNDEEKEENIILEETHTS